MAHSDMRQAAELAEAHNRQGQALAGNGLIEQALAEFQNAIRISPRTAQYHHNLGNALAALGRLDEAIAAYRCAIALKPDLLPSLNNLGNTLKECGRLDEALAVYRDAMRIAPDWFVAHSNFVYSIHFHPDYDAREIHRLHVEWNDAHARKFERLIQPHDNDRNPDRRLRIGYVSPDFCHHVVGRFMTPLIENHDNQLFEIFCYSSTRRPDSWMQRLRARANVWRDVVQTTDEQLAQIIRQDRIDILVDLTMHMNEHRLLVFAQKPAPVQATYLAYCSTTGLTAIDYRLTDPYLDPPDVDTSCYTEATVRLPKTYWCYEPVASPVVIEPPAVRDGYVTFGCLNNFAKASPPAMETWAKLLATTGNSRLILHCPQGSHRQGVIDIFAKSGIQSSRVEFVELLPLAKYLELYQRIDIALDPFPYCGGTTSCDALWMGVPVVTLHGKTAVGRGGASILSNMGLPDLIAHDESEYAQIASRLANDLPRLRELRGSLRQRMKDSPLMDARAFARDMEQAYRTIWREWCKR